MLSTPGRSGKYSGDLLKHQFVFLTSSRFGLLEQIQTLQEIQYDMLTNLQCICQTQPRVASIHTYSKKMSVFDGGNKNKCWGYCRYSGELSAKH